MTSGLEARFSFAEQPARNLSCCRSFDSRLFSRFMSCETSNVSRKFPPQLVWFKSGFLRACFASKSYVSRSPDVLWEPAVVAVRREPVIESVVFQASVLHGNYGSYSLCVEYPHLLNRLLTQNKDSPMQSCHYAYRT